MSSSGLHAPDPEDRATGLKLDDHDKLMSHSMPSTEVERDIDQSNGGKSEDVQAGIRKIEAISTAWTKWSLIVAYLSYVSSHVDPCFCFSTRRTSKAKIKAGCWLWLTSRPLRHRRHFYMRRSQRRLFLRTR
jgi:hypothetical protein